MEENNTFNFHIHRKVEIWVDEEINITAKDEESAKRAAMMFIYTGIEASQCDDSNVEFIGSEMIYESQRTLIPDECGGNPTVELYMGNALPQNLIAKNGRPED